MVNLANALQKEGITAFRFDFSGNGESEGTFQYGNYFREADDLQSAIQHFREANCVTSAILGHSKGGNVVLLYASKYHDVPRVINVSGRYKTEGGEFLYRVTEDSLMERLNTNMHEACLQIGKDCSVLTVHGSDDTIVRVKEASEFAKIIPNHKLHVVKGANHGFSKHQDELISVVLSFIKEPVIHEGK
ncbi:alpha/beta-Hydrolases superfamily protein [Artemisia annua]|uniref:Alpha/beta-Hydrolases superfamily protein n=1 Tax=Artemisia annua TaxID=35608 RepID=A0A2U1KDC6_ARTAN|nr:alpha/beta-Hydrolases superfamily protein [Artemisia annua]